MEGGGGATRGIAATQTPPTYLATPTGRKPHPHPLLVLRSKLIHQFLSPRRKLLCPAPRSNPHGSGLTSLKAPRPITFRISKSSLCSRTSLSLAAMGSTGGREGGDGNRGSLRLTLERGRNSHPLSLGLPVPPLLCSLSVPQSQFPLLSLPLGLSASQGLPHIQQHEVLGT